MGSLGPVLSKVKRNTERNTGKEYGEEYGEEMMRAFYRRREIALTLSAGELVEGIGNVPNGIEILFSNRVREPSGCLIRPKRGGLSWSALDTACGASRPSRTSSILARHC